MRLTQQIDIYMSRNPKMLIYMKVFGIILIAIGIIDLIIRGV